MQPNHITRLSILVPVYNEQECLDALYARLKGVADSLGVDVEMLFVNDGSTDSSLDILQRLAEADSRVAVVDLSRRFGKEIAMSAGIDYATGDALVILDADLQDPPELIPQMLEGIRQGYDDVYARRRTRSGESMVKRATSRLYYRMLRRLSNVPVQEDTGDFRMLSARAIEALRRLKESERNMKGLFSYVGFYKKPILYDRAPRTAGKTKWSYFGLTGLALRGFTSFSKTPLRLISLLGLMVSAIAFVYLIVVVSKALVAGDRVAGYPSLMAVILFLGGMQLLALGVIGEYIGIVFTESKRRPTYFVSSYHPAAGSHEKDSAS